jgi:hypothetical protein
MQVSERIKSFDRQYQVSSNVNSWVKKFQSAAKNMEENLREQAIYWQRAQRLREEQKQAQMIQQEIQRQHDRERSRQQGVPDPYPSSSSLSYEQQQQQRPQAQQPQAQQPQPGMGAGGGFQAVIGDAAGRWSDRSEVHRSHHQQQQHPHHAPSDGNQQPSASFSAAGGSSASYVQSQAGGRGGQGDGSSVLLSGKGPLFEFNSFLRGIGGPTSTKTRGNKLRADAESAAAAAAAAASAAAGSDEQLHGPVMGPAADPFAFASAPPMEDNHMGAVVGPTGAVGGGGGGQEPTAGIGGGGGGGNIQF